jgi:hypothetical protein
MRNSFFSSPLKFNDPFDSKVMFTFEGDKTQKRRFLAESLEISHPTMKKRERARFISGCLAKASFEPSPDMMGYDEGGRRNDGRLRSAIVINKVRRHFDVFVLRE